MEQIKESKEFSEFKARISVLITEMTHDAEKYYTKDNKAAGVRLRKLYKGIREFVKKTSDETLAKDATTAKKTKQVKA